MAGISATTMAWGQSKHANVLFERGEKTLSLSIDNSPVMNEKLTRVKIACCCWDGHVYFQHLKFKCRSSLQRERCKFIRAKCDLAVGNLNLA